MSYSSWILGWPSSPGALGAGAGGRAGLGIMTFDGWSAQYLRNWPNASEIELVYERWGPETGRIVSPALEEYWHYSQAMPGWRGVYTQIDPRGFGLPLWTGRLTAPQPSSDSPDLSAQLTGPREWLERYHVPLVNPSVAPAARLIYQALQANPPSPQVRLRLESAHMGAGVPDNLSGQSHWEAMTGLAERRSEWFYMTGVWGTPEIELNWWSGLSGNNLAGVLVLENGVNSTWDAVPDIEGKIDALLLLAESWNLGNRHSGSSARISPARAFGRKAALTAVVSSQKVRAVSGAMQTDARMSVQSRDAAAVAVEASLRQLCNSSIPVQFSVDDPSLWPMIRPGVIASGRWADPHGIFERCLIEIDTMTVAPLRGEMRCSGYLWDQED